MRADDLGNGCGIRGVGSARDPPEKEQGFGFPNQHQGAKKRFGSTCMDRAAKQRGSTSNVGIVKPGFPAGRVGLPRFFAAAQCKCPSKERRTSSHFVERSLGPKLVSLGRIGIRSLSMAP